MAARDLTAEALQQIEESLHAMDNYHALLANHTLVETGVFMDLTEQQRSNALSGTLLSFVETIPSSAVDQSMLVQIVKSKLPVRCTNIDNLLCDIKMSNRSIRAVARTFERRRRRIQRKIFDNDADLEEFTNEYDKYLPLRVPFKNAAAVRQYNTLKNDLEFCYKKKQEYATKLEETNNILNSMVIDTTIDDETTEESSIDD